MQQCGGSGEGSEGGGHRHKSPASLAQLSARSVRRVIVESVRRIRGRSASWVPRYFPCREPLSVCRHAVKTLHDYLLTTPHLFQVTFTWTLKQHQQKLKECIVLDLDKHFEPVLVCCGFFLS